MQTILKIGLLAVLGMATWAATAPTADAVLLNAADRIWDAFAQQGNVKLKGKYKESPENGLVDQTIEVQLDNVPGGTTVDVFVDGMFLGSMTANAMGTANLRRERLGLVPGPDGRPPAPRVEEGSVLMVVHASGVSLSATFTERP